MQLSLVGISHKTAPVAVREHFAFSAEELPGLLGRLGERYAGAAVLSTCNRTEVYVASGRGIGDARPIVGLLSEIKGEVAMEGAPFFAATGTDAARHLFLVAAGIESMVIGEAEVLGQVRSAFTAATSAGTHTPILSRAFHTAIRVGRRVRAQTNISRGTTSVSSAAAALARSTLGDLSGKTALVISAGDAGTLAARALASNGVAKIIVTSRSPERSGELAAELDGSTVPFDELGAALAQADVVITSTAAPHFLIQRPMIESAMRGRRARPILLIDIAVPRDVDPDVRAVRGVHLHDIDDLQAIAREGMRLRRKELAPAQAMVDEAAEKYGAWLRSLEVVPTVAALRSRAEALRIGELARTLARTSMSDADRVRVDAMTSALVKKLLHAPVRRLKLPGEGERYVEATRALFDLETGDDEREA